MVLWHIEDTNWESQVPYLSQVLWFYNRQAMVLVCPASFLSFSHWWGFFEHSPDTHSSCLLTCGMSWGSLAHIFCFTDKLLIREAQSILCTSLSLLLWWQTIFPLPSYPDSWLSTTLGVSPHLQSLRALPLSVVLLANLSQLCKWYPGNLLCVPCTVLDANRDKRLRKLHHSLWSVASAQRQTFYHSSQGPFSWLGLTLKWRNHGHS